MCQQRNANQLQDRESIWILLLPLECSNAPSKLELPPLWAARHSNTHTHTHSPHAHLHIHLEVVIHQSPLRSLFTLSKPLKLTSHHRTAPIKSIHPSPSNLHPQNSTPLHSTLQGHWLAWCRVGGNVLVAVFSSRKGEKGVVLVRCYFARHPMSSSCPSTTP